MRNKGAIYIICLVFLTIQCKYSKLENDSCNLTTPFIDEEIRLGMSQKALKAILPNIREYSYDEEYEIGKTYRDSSRLEFSRKSVTIYSFFKFMDNELSSYRFFFSVEDWPNAIENIQEEFPFKFTLEERKYFNFYYHTDTVCKTVHHLRSSILKYSSFRGEPYMDDSTRVISGGVYLLEDLGNVVK